MDQRTDKYQNQKSLLEKLESNNTNIDEANKLEYNVDACSCMGCGCFKSAWTVVLSPAGVATGMAAYALDASL